MAGKSNGVDSTAWARAPPKKGPFCERILKTIYDPDDNTFLGRTPKRWGIVLLFYLIFYLVLALLFAACMSGLFFYIDDNKPTYILRESLIGTNPGVSSRPRPQDEMVVRYKSGNSTSYDVYVEELKEFLQDYKNESWYNVKKECTEQDNFGFPDTPCFFIKLNRVYGWQPNFYSTVADLPADMSVDLAEYITQLPDNEHNQIWISCGEEHGNATGVEYPWGRGLPARFYPYLNQHKYISPLIAVKFTPPSNTLVTLRCRAWAKNIIYNKSLKLASGYTRILLRVDDPAIANRTDNI